MTLLSAGVSAGFSLEGLLGPGGGDSFARYAASRSVALLLTVLIAIIPAASVQDTPGIPGVAARGALAEQGRAIYLQEGCGFCHTQLVRDLPLDRPYGRATVAEDYANEDPPLPGTERTGPDLSNVAARQPSVRSILTGFPLHLPGHPG